MSDLNWDDLASTQLGTVERPPLKPAGHYLANIVGRGEQGTSSKKGTLYIEYPVTVTEALEDVDREELEAAGGPNFKGKITFYLTQQSLWRFKEFAAGLGASDDMGVLEAAEHIATSGEPFVVEARHEQDQRDSKTYYLRLENPIPLSAWQERQAA